MNAASDTRFEGVYCTIQVASLRPGTIVVTIEGRDTGELGEAPFREIEKRLALRVPGELFIDARGAASASVDVSGEWAEWLRANKASFRRISMLTATRFVQLSADFVRKFAGLTDVMRIYTEVAAFETALNDSGRQGKAGED